jgi:hypothetical protein
VHRLLPEAYRRGVADPEGLQALADELAAGDPELASEATSRAAAIVARLLAQPELAPRAGVRVIFEAAYSRRHGDAIERGAVDCLVVDGSSALLLEFKTGAPRDAHRDQLNAYVDAMRAAWPDLRVDGRLVYVPEA